ncbi:hypothetical protein [Sphingomonas sp. BK069]|uniref:hypothetical protein n=1 Tax=Sphingomonas sp. BK069 TaxID=2586979 RepID=UPI00160CF84C|nr:hypothetical protein [Sphingomonas sp. BK069]MBB3347345.1 hypothetical protein [Sphingomonas sp. BK069]
MNLNHHTAVDKASNQASNFALELGALLGMLSLAVRTNEFDPCQHAIICAEAMLPPILEQLEELEVSLRAVVLETRATVSAEQAA